MSPDGTQINKPVRVLVVDDTRTVRLLIRALASTHPEIEVIGEAANPIEAVEKLKELNPDVMTLDVEMPKMNGLTFLEKVLEHRPLPVVMISSHTTEHSDTAVKALALGAFECFDVKKLRPGDPAANRLSDVLVAAGRSSRFAKKPAPSAASTAPVKDASSFVWNGKTVVMGSSTGGVEALITVLSDFPPNGPPVLIAQHMPKHFLASFAQRLNKLAAPEVVLARSGDVIEQGKVYIGPGGDEHVALDPGNPNNIISVRKLDADLYSPSVDVLFSSAAQLESRVVAVVLTGMGRDGAEGMLAIRNAGGHTIAQSGETAVVDGMPRAARGIGAAKEIRGLSEIASEVLAATSRRGAGG